MRNLIFRVLAGLIGLASLLTTFNAVLDLNIMALVYLFVGSLFLIFAFGGYKATDWADYYMNRAADKIADLFSKK
jgi:hypothetical protein